MTESVHAFLTNTFEHLAVNSTDALSICLYGLAALQEMLTAATRIFELKNLCAG